MYEFLEYRVKHVMTPDPVTIAADAPLSRAEALFAEHDFNALPVVSAGGELLGILTKLDALKGFAFSTDSVIPKYEEIARAPVEELMTRDVERVDPELPLTRVLERMIASGHKSLPVVDGERLAGVVAREDVLRALQRAAAGQGPAGR